MKISENIDSENTDSNVSGITVSNAVSLYYYMASS